MRRLPALLAPILLALLAAGCPRTPEAGGPIPDDLTPEERVARLRHDGEALLQAQAELLWRTWTRGEAVDLSQPYARHPGLFDDAALAAVRARREGATGEDRRALDLLHDWLVSERLAEATAEAEDALADFQAGAVVVVDGHPRPWRDLARLLAETEDAEARRAIQAAAGPVLEEMAPLLEARDARLEEAATGMGYPSVTALAEDLRNLDLAEAAARAQRVLEATDPLWRETLDRRARAALGVPGAQVGRADLPRLVVLPALDAHLPGDALAPTVRAALEALGLAPDAGGRVRWDVEARPRKSPRAFCLPVAVPGDLRLSVLPRAGRPALEGVLGEAGVCQRLAAVEAERFEFRRLGPGPWVEAFHHLFGGLASDRRWLEAHTGLAPEARAHAAEAGALERLLQVRRHAIRVLLAAREAGGLGPEAADAAWRTLSERAWGFSAEPGAAPGRTLERDPLLGSAEALEGLLLAASLEAAAVQRFGADWWRAPEAGAWLAALWAPGAAPTPAELRARAWASAGGRPVAPETALAESLRRALGTSPGA